MLSTPRSLGFVLAVILGAMLVPGCRSEDDSSGPSSRPTYPLLKLSGNQVLPAKAIPGQYMVVFKPTADPTVEAPVLVA